MAPEKIGEQLRNRHISEFIADPFQSLFRAVYDPLNALSGASGLPHDLSRRFRSGHHTILQIACQPAHSASGCRSRSSRVLSGQAHRLSQHGNDR